MTLQCMIGFLAVLVAGTAAAAGPELNGLPVPVPPPTVYTRPTPAPVAPPINPGPAVVPPAGLSPLLTEPGPVSPQTVTAIPALPSYPAASLPGPVGEQNTQAYRNRLIEQQWRLERSGVSPDSERSREIHQQLNTLGSK